MNTPLVEQALAQLLIIGRNKKSREAAAAIIDPLASLVAKEIYSFVVDYPANWSVTSLTDKLLSNLRVSIQTKYPYLSDDMIRRLANHFAYLWK